MFSLLIVIYLIMHYGGYFESLDGWVSSCAIWFVVVMIQVAYLQKTPIKKTLLDDDKKRKIYSVKGDEDVKKTYRGRRLQVINLQLIMCGGMVQRKST